MELSSSTNPEVKMIFDSIESVDHNNYTENTIPQMEKCKKLIENSFNELSEEELTFLRFVLENKYSLLDESSKISNLIINKK